MLIQTSSPRPILSLQEHPKHIVIHTLCRFGISKGEVLLNMNTDIEHGTRMTAPIEPHEVFPIEGEPGFEAHEYYLPFDVLFGTNRAEYNEHDISERQSKGVVKRVNLEDRRAVHSDVVMSRFIATGISVIVHSAYRTEGSQYEERILNFQLFFPLTGGGIIRFANSLFDVTNPTFDPKAAIPRKSAYKNDVLLNAFNRTHKTGNPDIERRKRERIAQAEASMASDDKALPAAPSRRLPPKR